MRDIIDGESHDVELYPGDVLFVTDHWIEDFGEITNMIAPLASIAFSVAAILIALDNSALTRRLTEQATTTPMTPVTPAASELRLSW